MLRAPGQVAAPTRSSRGAKRLRHASPQGTFRPARDSLERCSVGLAVACSGSGSYFAPILASQALDTVKPRGLATTSLTSA